MAASTHTGDRGSREEAQGAAPSSLPSEWPCLPRSHLWLSLMQSCLTGAKTAGGSPPSGSAGETPRRKRRRCAMLTLGERKATVLRAQTLLTGLGPSRGCSLPCRTAHVWNLAASPLHLSPRAQTRTKVSKMSVRPFAAPSQGLAKLALCLPGEGVPAGPHRPSLGRVLTDVKGVGKDIYLLIKFSVTLLCKTGLG